MSEIEKNPRGMSFVESLQLAFIVLKLTGYIDWNWGWVLSPILTVVLAIILVAISEVLTGD